MTSLDHIFPAPAAGTLGLLLCLDTWSNRVPQQGGFREPRTQAKALDLGCAIIRAACKHPFQIFLKCSDRWRFSWPRPDVTCDRVVRLVVAQNGNVNLEALRDAAASNVGVLARPRIECLAWGKLRAEVDAKCSIPLHTL